MATTEGEVPIASVEQDDKPTTYCHCGRVQVQLPSTPKILTECHCTVCYKYGALWGYFKRKDVTVTTAAGTKLESYSREDVNAELSFNRCSHCGCMMLWWNLDGNQWSGPEEEMGVNCRMLPEKEIAAIERRQSPGP